MTGVIQLPNPHNGQRAIIQSPARFKWLAAGRRWRKTTLKMAVAVEAALRGEQILWGAPTFDQCRIGWAEMYKAAGNVAEFRIGRMQVGYPGGGLVTFRSLDNPDNARGYTADGIIIDEAPKVKRQAWYEVLRPIISDTNGWALLGGTPAGRNWFWQEWTKAQNDDQSAAWSVPVLGAKIVDGELKRVVDPLENPDFSWEELLRIYGSTPTRIFRQEYLGEFIDDTGGVFRGVQAAATATYQLKAVEGHEYAFGVDWAKHNDFTVISVIDITDNEMCAMDRFNRIDYTTQRGRLRALYEKFMPYTVVAERNSMGDPVIEELIADDIPVQPFTATNASKKQAIEALALAFERGVLAILDEPALIGELQAFEATRLPSGMLRYAHPEGMHDDCVISLALAWHAVSAGSLFVF